MALETLTINEFWQLRGILDAHGDVVAAEVLGMPVEVMVLGIYPGLESENLARLRDAIAKHPVKTWT